MLEIHIVLSKTVKSFKIDFPDYSAETEKKMDRNCYS